MGVTKEVVMSVKFVTSNQVKSIQQMANEKGVGRRRFQKALDDGVFAKLLDSLKPSLGVPPKGARVFLIRKVRDSFVAIASTKAIEGDLVLVNYAEGGGSWNETFDWAQSVGLQRTGSDCVHFIGEQCPNLPDELGVTPNITPISEGSDYYHSTITIIATMYDGRISIFSAVDFNFIKPKSCYPYKKSDFRKHYSTTFISFGDPRCSPPTRPVHSIHWLVFRK